jgi:hypothetical protein
VAGLEPAPLDFSAERSLAIKLLLLMGITNDQRPIEIEMVRKPGFAPGPSPSQGEMLLLHHNPEERRSHVDLQHEPPPSQSGVQN